MNGRVYDPTIGRFLSADPIIQTLAISQAINPFSYVMNNPLALIDPSGYSWLSKLFHSIGNWFHSQIFRLILSIIVAIYLPYFGPAFFSSGFLGAVATGAIAGGIAAGNLKGALYGAIAAGLAYGISSAINAVHSYEYSMTHMLAANGEQLQEITITAKFAAAVTHEAAAAAGGVAGAAAGAAAAAPGSAGAPEQATGQCTSGVNNSGAQAPSYSALKFDPKGPGQWAVSASHKLDALTAYNLAQDAKLVTRIKFGWGTAMWNNAPDAFRHGYWSFTMTRSIGASEAKQFGDAHEISGPSPIGERTMDLYNNQVGRDIASSTPATTGAYQAISDAMNNGCLRVSPY